MRKGLISLAAAGLTAVLGVMPVLAASYARIGQVKNFPGKVQGFDISWFDRDSHSYLFADRTNNRAGDGAAPSRSSPRPAPI
jgi:hypothetical protein